MNAILSHQNAKPNGLDILVINGELSEYRGTEEQDKAQNLTVPSNNMKPQKFLSWLFRKGGASSSMRLYYNKDEGVLITSNMISKDEIGRRIVYSFFCDTINNPTYVKKLLEDYCTMASVKPNSKDCEAIEKLLRIQKNKNKNLSIGIVICVIIISIICLVAKPKEKKQDQTSQNRNGYVLTNRF